MDNTIDIDIEIMNLLNHVNRMNVFDEAKVQDVLKITNTLPKWVVD